MNYKKSTTQTITFENGDILLSNIGGTCHVLITEKWSTRVSEFSREEMLEIYDYKS